MKAYDEIPKREKWAGAGATETISLTLDRVLLKTDLLKQEKVTTGGIVLPATRDKREDAQVGEVRGYGPGFYTHTGTFVPIDSLVPGIAFGARVAFQRNGGLEQPIELDGHAYLIVRSAEIVGVLRGE